MYFLLSFYWHLKRVINFLDGRPHKRILLKIIFRYISQKNLSRRSAKHCIHCWCYSLVVMWLVYCERGKSCSNSPPQIIGAKPLSQDLTKRSAVVEGSAGSCDILDFDKRESKPLNSTGSKVLPKAPSWRHRPGDASRTQWVWIRSE